MLTTLSFHPFRYTRSVRRWCRIPWIDEHVKRCVYVRIDAYTRIFVGREARLYERGNNNDNNYDNDNTWTNGEDSSGGNTCGESWHPKTDAISGFASFLTCGQVRSTYRYRLRVPSCGFESRQGDAMGLMLLSVAYSPLPFASPTQCFSSPSKSTRTRCWFHDSSKHRTFRGGSPGNPMTDLRHKLLPRF